jgi:hypothetical protein
MKFLKKAPYFLLLLINISFAQDVQIAGYVKEKKSGEAIIATNITFADNKNGVQSNRYGFFSLKITSNKSEKITFSIIGYQTLTKEFILKKDTLIEIYLEDDIKILDEVVVNAQKQPESKKNKMSSITLSASQIKQMPLILGEKDPLKALQLLPGVQQGNEGSSNIYVRGGGADQNLILLDEGIVYNANHLFGFFSTFNADPIKQVELYKGGLPARYGGRLSSVVDVQMKEGNKESFHGEGGVGIISSRLTLEGPIKKKHSSFLISARRTYADILISPFLDKNSKVGYYFFDINSKINFDINPKNNLYFSIYTGKDDLYTKDIVQKQQGPIINRLGIDWGNITSTIRWNHLYNKKLFSNLSLVYTNYHFGLSDYIERQQTTQKVIQNLSFLSSVQDFSVKVDFDYFLNQNTQIKWGAIHTYHQFQPRSLNYTTNRLGDTPFENNAAISNNIEGAAYIEKETKYNLFTTKMGVRFSYFGINKQFTVRTEPRLLINIPIGEQKSIKASYARMNQYVHLLSNTGVGFPTDLWVPSTKNIKPAFSDQLALGIVKDFKQNFSITIEAYYKWQKNTVNYKDGANFLGLGEGVYSTPFVWEDNITQGRGWSYGYELFLQKNVGKLTGFLGYTLSWSILQFKELNQGKPFYSQQDRRHDFEATASYKISNKIRISANGVFSTGNALSIPRGLFFREDYGTSYLLEYGQQNGFRAEPYHRVDLGIQFYKKRRWGERYVDFSVYNTYFRKNPYSYTVQPNFDFVAKTNALSIKRSWLLPILPSISHNFKF